MKINYFSIFDSKAEAYITPFAMKSLGQATRAFEDSANDPNHQFNKHAGDFTLFHIGTWDDQTCTFENLNAPINLGTATTYIKGIKNEK